MRAAPVSLRDRSAVRPYIYTKSREAVDDDDDDEKTSLPQYVCGTLKFDLFQLIKERKKGKL